MAILSINSERLLVAKYNIVTRCMDIQTKTTCMVINPIMVDIFASLLNCKTTELRLPLQSVSEGWTINVCWRAHHGPVCGFLVFSLQVSTYPFALFQSKCGPNICLYSRLSLSGPLISNNRSSRSENLVPVLRMKSNSG